MDWPPPQRKLEIIRTFPFLWQCCMYFTRSWNANATTQDTHIWPGGPWTLSDAVPHGIARCTLESCCGQSLSGERSESTSPYTGNPLVFATAAASVQRGSTWGREDGWGRSEALSRTLFAHLSLFRLRSFGCYLDYLEKQQQSGWRRYQQIVCNSYELFVAKTLD